LFGGARPGGDGEVDAADGGEVEVALVIDVVDEEADLVEVGGEHDARGAFGVEGEEGVAVDIGGDLVGVGFEVFFDDGGGGLFGAGDGGGGEELGEEVEGGGFHVGSLVNGQAVKWLSRMVGWCGDVKLVSQSRVDFCS
jgi:hypothetical protein